MARSIYVDIFIHVNKWVTKNLRVEKTTDITKRLHRIKTKIAVDAKELIAKY
jgi:hypothetical protein